MIRICYIIGQLGKGGAERQLYELVRGINKKRFHPIVISLSQGGYWKEEMLRLGAEVFELKRKRSKDLGRLFSLISILKRTRPHIVHTYMMTGNSYGRIAAILARVPIIIASERSTIEIGKDKKRRWIYLDKFLSFFSNGIICNSEKAYRTLIDKFLFDPHKVFTVYNGVKVSDFIERCPCGSGRSGSKVVGTVGTLYEVKNHKLFLDMAKNVLERCAHDNVNFAIVGKGELRDELEAYARYLGIEDRVLFTGERNDVPDLLKGMDIFVLTSLYEGLSNAIMEAMASGLPVVATDVGGNSELIIDGETGYLCSSNDATALAEKVITLLNDADLARRIGEMGRQRIMNEFGIERMIKETESIYTKLLENRYGPNAG